MKDMTLSEINNAFGITRRAIQGYEKEKLVSSSGKNERGYLLYDEKSQERIKQIKLFQQMGFSVKEIKNIIDAPNDILKSVLEKQVKKQEAKKENIEESISKIYELMKKL